MQDYIAHDEGIKNLFFQARKQNVGMIVAHHDLTQIAPVVQAALQHCAVRCIDPVAQGIFTYVVEDKKRNTYTVPIPPVKFSRMPMMSKEEWADILDKQQRFCVPIGATHIKKRNEPAHIESFDEE